MVNNWPSRQDIWNWWALEWFKVAAYPALLDIVCRASNRMLVGLPLCESFLSCREIKIYIYIGRDLDYLELNKRFAADLIKTSYILSMVPFFLRPYILVIGTVCRCWSFFSRVVARLMNGVLSIKHGMKHIGPFVKERVEQEARYGKDWPDRPVCVSYFLVRWWFTSYQNDVLTWLSETSKGKEHTLEDITMRILFINLASIHPTTIARRVAVTA